MLSLNFAQAANAIATIGATNAIMLRGQPGIGKSALLSFVAQTLPDYLPAYIDCANLDLGDVAMPVVDRDSMVTHYAPNSRFGIAKGSTRPVIIMLDEFPKAPKAVQNMLLPLVLERRIGDVPLPVGSIVFLTGNLDTDGVGDRLEPHVCNRMTGADFRNPTAAEWLDWAAVNDVSPSVMVFARDNPMIFDRYDQIDNKKENPYIFNPLAGNVRAFCSPRSLEKASNIIKAREALGDAVLPLLAGTVGEPAARMLEASIALEDRLPRTDVILADPMAAPLPKDAVAAYMLAIRCASQASPKTIEAFVDYATRWPHMESKTLFATSIARNSKKVVWAIKTTNFRNLAAACGKFF